MLNERFLGYKVDESRADKKHWEYNWDGKKRFFNSSFRPIYIPFTAEYRWKTRSLVLKQYRDYKQNANDDLGNIQDSFKCGWIHIRGFFESIKKN